MIVDISVTLLLAVSAGYFLYSCIALLRLWFMRKKQPLTETFDTERLIESVQNQLNTWRGQTHPPLQDTEFSTGSKTPLEASMHNESDHGSDAKPALVKR